MSIAPGMRPGSFAGFPFWWRDLRGEGGGEVAIHRIPFSPPDLEYLGPGADRFRLTCFFIGAGWMIEREAFIALLAATTKPATLILPTKGPLRVRPLIWTYSDNSLVGNIGFVEVQFIVDASVAAPFAGTDTASLVLSSIATAQQAIINSYIAVAALAGGVGATISYTENLLASAQGAFADLPATLLAGITGSFAAAPSDFAGTAAAITGAFLAAGDNAAAAIAAPLAAAPSAILGSVPSPAAPADPTQGLAALASWQDSVPPANYAPPALGQMRAAVTALVEQSAALAVASLAAQMEFSTTQQAAAMRAQLAAIFDAVAQTAYDSGDVDMYRTLCALQAQTGADMLARAQNLPTLAAYTERRSLPAAVLAQLLYQDGSQGAALAALNGAPHPLFMPPAGIWLEAA